MHINNNDRPWRIFGDDNSFNAEKFYSFLGLPKWDQFSPGWDTTSWENLTKSVSKNTAPLNEQTYFFNGKAFTSYQEFQDYIARTKREKDIRESKREAILERLKDPLENNVDEEVVCKCGKSLEIFAIPYQIVDNGNTYQGHIYIEYCARCQSFVERCYQGRDAYLAIAKKELAAQKKSN